MLISAAVAWVPLVTGIGLALLVLAVVWLCNGASGSSGPDDDLGSDGPGGSRRPPPRRPLPTGPMNWVEFEGEFAAYVERGRRHGVVTADDPSGDAAAPVNVGP